MTDTPQNVYAKIAAFQGELAKTGISKDGNNSAQGYKFRGIDQVYGALSPLLARHGLCVLPRIIEREMHERVTIKEWNGQKKESVLFYVTVTAEFDFVSADDGSTHTVRTYGEAMDSGDKATNKAMSAAYKYAALMTFAIPTEGDNDADATTHEVGPTKAHAKPAKAEVRATVDRDTVTQMIALCEALGGNQAQVICDAYKVSALSELNAKQATAAIKRLNEKLAERAAEQETKTQGFGDIDADSIPY